MELRISDNFDEIPENKSVAKLGLSKDSGLTRQPIKIVKQQQVQQQPVQQPVQTIKPSLSGVKSRMVRPQTPAPKPKVSYEDILTNMGMYLEDGKLRLIGSKQSQNQSAPLTESVPYQSEQKQSSLPVTKSVNKPLQQSVNKPLQQSVNKPLQQSTQNQSLEQNNSYIYQKYFKNSATEEAQDIRRPLTILEYRDMLIANIIQKYKIKQIKSSKLIMPTSNINFAQGPSGNLNKLFSFSQR